MLEKFTTSLNLEETRAVLARAKQLKSYRPVKKTNGAITLRRSTLDGLSNYQVDDEYMGLTVTHTGMPVSLEDVVTFWNTMEELGPSAIGSCDLDISEDGQKFDVDDVADISIQFGAVGASRYFKFEFGSRSVGRSRSAVCGEFRGALLTGPEPLRDFADALGGNLPVRFGALPVQLMDDFDYQAVHALDNTPTVAYISPSEQTGLMAVDDVQLWNVPQELLRPLCDNAISTLRPGQLVRAQMKFYFKKLEQYRAATEVLNRCSARPWTVEFLGAANYSVDQLVEHATVENSSFLVNAFALKVPGIGSVDVELSFGNGEFGFNFMVDYQSDRQEQLLEQLIIDLAGGQDVVNRELI